MKIKFKYKENMIKVGDKVRIVLPDPLPLDAGKYMVSDPQKRFTAFGEFEVLDINIEYEDYLTGLSNCVRGKNISGDFEWTLPREYWQKV